jgi:ATP synthase protein I
MLFLYSGVFLMDDIHKLYQRYRRLLLFLSGIYLFGIALTPYRAVFAGLLLGTLFSFYNLRLMVRKAVRLSEAVKGGRNMADMGTFSRMAAAVLAVLVAIRFPGYFHLLSTAVGVFSLYIILFLDFLIHLIYRLIQREER